MTALAISFTVEYSSSLNFRIAGGRSKPYPGQSFSASLMTQRLQPIQTFVVWNSKCPADLEGKNLTLAGSILKISPTPMPIMSYKRFFVRHLISEHGRIM
jgi:hypothetical protein